MLHASWAGRNAILVCMRTFNENCNLRSFWAWRTAARTNTLATLCPYVTPPFGAKANQPARTYDNRQFSPAKIFQKISPLVHAQQHQQFQNANANRAGNRNRPRAPHGQTKRRSCIYIYMLTTRHNNKKQDRQCMHTMSLVYRSTLSGPSRPQTV